MCKGNKPIASPGIFVVLWEIVLLFKEHNKNGLSIIDINDALSNSGILGGKPPIKGGIEFGKKNGLFDIEEGLVTLTSYCREEIFTVDDDENPYISFIRELIYSDIKTNKYTWLFFFTHDLLAFKASIPQEWIEILDCALLLEEEGLVHEWWEKLYDYYRDYDNERNIKIGDVGEKLTLEFETRRLKNEGLDSDYSKVIWVARFRDDLGYDIKSYRGQTLLEGKVKEDEIQIEVKSSSLSNEEIFSFNVTKNEWEKAKEDYERYYYFCWVGINVERKLAKSGPFIISARSLLDQFPENTSEKCNWIQCRFTIDLSEVAQVKPPYSI